MKCFFSVPYLCSLKNILRVSFQYLYVCGINNIFHTLDALSFIHSLPYCIELFAVLVPRCLVCRSLSTMLVVLAYLTQWSLRQELSDDACITT